MVRVQVHHGDSSSEPPLRWEAEDVHDEHHQQEYEGHEDHGPQDQAVDSHHHDRRRDRAANSIGALGWNNQLAGLGYAYANARIWVAVEFGG